MAGPGGALVESSARALLGRGERTAERRRAPRPQCLRQAALKRRKRLPHRNLAPVGKTPQSGAGKSRILLQASPNEPPRLILRPRLYLTQIARLGRNTRHRR